MYPIGCRAYALNQHIKKADKTESRALIGHLVGYQGTNIFRVWLPAQDEVIVTRDFIFDTARFYSNENDYVQQSFIRQNIELLEYPENNFENNISIEELLTQRQRRYHNTVLSTPIRHERIVGGENIHDIEKDTQEADPQVQGQLLTPAPSDFEDVLEDNNTSNSDITTQVIPQEDSEKAEDIPESYSVLGGYRTYGEVAPKQINLNPYDTSLIVTGKRNRRQAPNRNVFAIYFHVISLGTKPLTTYLYTFKAEISKHNVVDNIPQLH